MNNPFSWDAFNKIPIVGIMRNIPQQQMQDVAAMFHASGLNTLEITMNSVAAEETISYLATHFGDRLNIGAGTVCTLKDLDKALAAGATFVVTPILKKKLIKACVAEKIPIFPGAYTPTEIYNAWTWGASMVKVFPATRLGPAYIKEVLAPLPDLKLIPTGGISRENFTAFLSAGATGLGIGSELFPLALINNSDPAPLKQLFAAYVEKYQHYLLTGEHGDTGSR
ncbi:MAG: bifunctional 4-hydroxy-2-oxoglutarate aldolase/2-dehydro-3-deoxy-phosphogluconate aldolase [Chitinophagaceae bacterium]